MTVNLPPLSALFSFEVREESGVACLYASLPDANFNQAVQIVAREIAVRRISANPRLYEVWRVHAEDGSADPISQSDGELLAAGLLQNIGTPGKEAPLNHLHGLVAEELWLELISQRDLGLGAPVRVEGHDWSVTDPGGDGLTVHEAPAGFCFRLWESKYVGSDDHSVRETVGLACRQMKGRALSYLARFSLIAQRITEEPKLATFYGLLGEMWVNKDPSAGASVVIGASQEKVEDNCFEGIPGFFEFSPERHQGQLNAVGDFDRFAKAVRQLLWRGCGWTEH